jgi:hypothetical protein
MLENTVEKNPPLTSMKLASRAPLSESNVAVVKDYNLVDIEKSGYIA